MAGPMSADGAPARARRRDLIPVVLAATVGPLPAFLTGALATQIREDLRFGPGALGLAVGSHFAAAAMASAPLGRVSEGLGPSRALRLGSAVSAALLLGAGLLSRSWGLLVVFLAAGGVANALIQPAANLFLTRIVPERRQALAFATKQSAIPAGTLLGGLAVPAIALTVGWRWAYVSAAALAVVAALAVPRLSGHAAVRTTAPPRLKEPQLALLACGVAFGAAAAGALAGFLVTAAVDSGISAGPAGLLLSGGSVIGISVRLSAGAWLDRRGGEPLGIATSMLIGGALAYALMAAHASLVYLAAVPLAFGAGWAWPGLSNLAVVRMRPEAPGAATGIMQIGTYLGAVLGPLVFGLAVDATSYTVGWLLASGSALVGAAAFTIARRLGAPDTSPVP